MSLAAFLTVFVRTRPYIELNKLIIIIINNLIRANILFGIIHILSALLYYLACCNNNYNSIVYNTHHCICGYALCRKRKEQTGRKPRKGKFGPENRVKKLGLFFGV